MQAEKGGDGAIIGDTVPQALCLGSIGRERMKWRAAVRDAKTLWPIALN